MQHPPVAETRRQAPATCGELVQGAIQGQDFLVNCPINLFARASVRPIPHLGMWLDAGQECSKIAGTIALAAERLGLELRHTLRLDSPIPRGKGMASSTADISAALQAVCASCGRSLNCADFAALITAIEPSDCVHVPGIAHVNHLTGQVIASLPPPTGLRVAVLDCGGEVDTVGFDRERARGIYREEEPRIAAALALLCHGLRHDDLGAVADAATESARVSQRILLKPPFEALLSLARAAGALGVNCAHSGTVLGVLYREDARLQDELPILIEQELGDAVTPLGDFAVIGGGCLAF